MVVDCGSTEGSEGSFKPVSGGWGEDEGSAYSPVKEE